ncbi:MAG: PmbA/TldA family metallopeptidase, partial [Solirubrobacterales bacterium]
MSAELSEIAARAVEAASAAGAGDVEAYVEDSRGLELRVYQDEVESLSESGSRGVGVRAWIEHRAGFAYGTDLSPDGLGEIAEAAVGAARIADPDEHSAPPVVDLSPDSDDKSTRTESIPGLADSGMNEWTTERKVELARAIEAASREADDRVEV